jgi:hypothetical protein
MLSDLKGGYKSVKEINKFLAFNVHNPPSYENPKDLTLEDIKTLKDSRDYLDNIYKKYTQTIRNDTYKP